MYLSQLPPSRGTAAPPTLPPARHAEPAPEPEAEYDYGTADDPQDDDQQGKHANMCIQFSLSVL